MKTFQVGARHAGGTTSLWHVPAENAQQAALDVENNILTHKPFQSPAVVLVCIPGGKS